MIFFTFSQFVNAKKENFNEEKRRCLRRFIPPFRKIDGTSVLNNLPKLQF